MSHLKFSIKKVFTCVNNTKHLVENVCLGPASLRIRVNVLGDKKQTTKL